MFYCENCGREVETKIVNRLETFAVLGENIEIECKVMVCAECGEELFCEELDAQTLNDAYNEYRRIHKLLLPEEIRKIREQYGLSQRGFAKLLNWGDKTICRYENGSLQDKAHNSILLLLREPENMRKYLMENELTIDEKQKKKLLERINSLEAEAKIECDENLPMQFEEPCEENGFKSFDYDKLCAMVLFFATESQELLKTKLMKLLNYADMIFYKENGVSISGLKYIHLPYGPVPENFDLLLGKMASDDVLHIDVLYNNGYEKHRIIPDAEAPNDVLSKAEISVLKRIFDKFKEFGSVEISNYSHKEKGYTQTRQGQIISYKYAKDIVLD